MWSPVNQTCVWSFHSKMIHNLCFVSPVCTTLSHHMYQCGCYCYFPCMQEFWEKVWWSSLSVHFCFGFVFVFFKWRSACAHQRHSLRSGKVFWGWDSLTGLMIKSSWVQFPAGAVGEFIFFSKVNFLCWLLFQYPYLLSHEFMHIILNLQEKL